MIVKADSWTSYVAGFQELTTLPNTAGAIDGRHIKNMDKSPRKYNLPGYWSKDSIYSVMFQGVCDHKRDLLICVVTSQVVLMTLCFKSM